MSRRSNRRPRREVAAVLKSTVSGWGGKRYWTLRLVCGHIAYTRNNACQTQPKTAGCEDCLKLNEAAEGDRE